MTNYIPHYTKKAQILGRKEDALRRLIARNSDQKKVVTAAEAVRDARIRVLRARRATIAPKDEAQWQYDAIDAQIQAILDTPNEVILAEFGYTVNRDIE